MKTYLLLAAALLLLSPADLARAQQDGQGQAEEKKEPQAEGSKLKSTKKVPRRTKGRGAKDPVVVIIDGKAYSVTPTELPKGKKDAQGNQDAETDEMEDEDLVSLEPRLHPDAEPITAEEYERKKVAYQAKLAERERLERENLRLQQETMEKEAAEREAKSAEAAASRVGVRKDLAPLPERPKPNPEMAKSMAAWYGTYELAIRPFKNDLGQVLALGRSRNAIARRDACRNLYVSSETLLKGKTLDAPDAAVKAPALAMAQKFHHAANTCLEGKADAAQAEMKDAEQDLIQMAQAMDLYSLVP